MADHRLPLLNRLEQMMPARPAGRTVVLGAKLTCDAPIPVPPGEIRPLEPGSPIQVAGRIAIPQRPPVTGLEAMAWNTGESRDLKRFGTLTHAERQLYETLRPVAATSIEIELSHSPCAGCADLLVAWLRRLNGQAAPAAPGGMRVLNGRKVFSQPTPGRIPARLAWAKLYDAPPQPTTWPALDALAGAGWHLCAPRSGLPPGEGRALVTLL